MPQTEHDMLKSVIDLRANVAMIEDQLKDAKQQCKEAETKLVTYLQNQDLKGFKSSALAHEVTMREELRVTILEEKDEDAFRFIDEECGRPDAIKTVRSVHWKTLSSIIGGLIEKGEKLPENVFNRYWQPLLTIKKL